MSSAGELLFGFLEYPSSVGATSAGNLDVNVLEISAMATLKPWKS